MNSQVRIGRLNKEDYKVITEIHLQAFKHFFLTSLGKKFLQTYYKACISSKESISIGAFDINGAIIGFSIGCIRSRGFHKRLVINNLLPFLVSSFVLVFKRPTALLRLIKNLEKKSSIHDNGEYSELLSIAVHPSFMGSGIGKLLMVTFENEVYSRGGKIITLTTDLNNNDYTLNFYRNSGYFFYQKFVSYPNRKMVKLIKNS